MLLAQAALCRSKIKPFLITRDARMTSCHSACAVIITLVLCGNFAWAQIPVTKKARPKSVQKTAIIKIDGPIDYKLAKFFDTRLKQAQQAGVDLLVVEIDSPGGLKTESLDIAEKLRDVDWAYTVAFIPREAISGGALIAFGCDEIVISPTANFGDIGEIYLDPEANAFRFVPAKYKSYLVSAARNLAVAKGRPPELVEALIDKDALVYVREVPRGKPLYKVVHVGSDEKPGEPWELVKETGPERFLTVSGARACELGIAETIGETQADLANEFHFEAGNVRQFKANWTDAVVYYLNTPFVTGLLVVIGLIALYIEFSASGRWHRRTDGRFVRGPVLLESISGRNLNVAGGVAVYCGNRFPSR